MNFVTQVNHKRCLYVGGLDKSVTVEILTAAFLPFGPIKDIHLPMDYTTTTQKNKGHGFIEYSYEEDAKEAIDNMNDSELYGKNIQVIISKPQNILKLNHAIWNKNLD